MEGKWRARPPARQGRYMCLVLFPVFGAVNQIGDEGAKVLAEALVKNAILTVLYLHSVHEMRNPQLIGGSKPPKKTLRKRLLYATRRTERY